MFQRKWAHFSSILRSAASDERTLIRFDIGHGNIGDVLLIQIFGFGHNFVVWPWRGGGAKDCLGPIFYTVSGISTDVIASNLKFIVLLNI